MVGEKFRFYYQSPHTKDCSNEFNSQLHVHTSITKKRSSAITSLLRSCRQLSTSPRWRNPAKCLSQRHNKQTCRLVLHTVPLSLSVKQGSCEYQLSTVIGFTRLGIKPESTAPEAYSLTTRPSELSTYSQFPWQGSALAESANIVPSPIMIDICTAMHDTICA